MSQNGRVGNERLKLQKSFKLNSSVYRKTKVHVGQITCRTQEMRKTRTTYTTYGESSCVNINA